MAARSKVLRIASIVDGLVCDELHQSAAESVTAGTDVGNQLLCFGAAVPQRHVLFVVQDGRYVLDLPQRVGGQLVMRGRAVNIGQLWRKRLREDPRARSLRVALDPSTRGKLDVGETTLLFQFAAPQPVPPKPPFPAEFKARPTNMWTRSDMATLFAAFMLFGPYFIWASNKHIDYTIEPEIDERFLRVMNLERTKPKKEEPEEEKNDEEVLAKEDEQLKPKQEDKVIDKPVITQKTYSKESMDKARGVGIARVLGTYGGNGPGTVFDVIQSTENNLGELFAAGMTATVLPDGTVVSPYVPGGEGISAQGAIVGTKGFEAQGPELAELEKKERKINSSVKSSGADVYGDADKKAVQATIRQRTGALQACYNKALQTNPGLAGKISYTITISVMGTVTDVRINDDSLQDAGVQTCTVAKIKGWRFPTTPGAEQASDVTFAVVFSGGS
ncbi:AgmX/PglI C-terminal domain-containing protein [Nannocystis radixulma]|uniref:AgmX/PglI C-terminal domain-containing protein n=1 Tax=Nannocystis radixulma TaxID=2995305 RepID=A0ABT5B8D1_9BACT|nr:AgmX/PglI C-terminal domain-containing protein [Nannocystis radixulma]MDC0670380.1 AgmX/PglI C-terminal domain-containing protein [Nannocystis radixulma]